MIIVFGSSNGHNGSSMLQTFVVNLITCPETVDDEAVTPKVPRKMGRPKKLFDEKKPDSQYREACEILTKLENYSFESIIRALSLFARREKKIHAAAIFHELEEDTDCRALRLRQAKKFYEEYPRKICLLLICTYPFHFVLTSPVICNHQP